MARNFSETPKEYKKLRCYTKNGSPFYIRHDTFIKRCSSEETENVIEKVSYENEKTIQLPESYEIVKTENQSYTNLVLETRKELESEKEYKTDKHKIRENVKPNEDKIRTEEVFIVVKEREGAAINNLSKYFETDSLIKEENAEETHKDKENAEGVECKATEDTNEKRKYKRKKDMARCIEVVQQDVKEEETDVMMYETDNIEYKSELEKHMPKVALTKLEEERLKQIEENLVLRQKEAKYSEKDNQSELKYMLNSGDIMWETEISVNSVSFENAIKVEEGQVGQIDEIEDVLYKEEEVKAVSGKNKVDTQRDEDVEKGDKALIAEIVTATKLDCKGKPNISEEEVSEDDHKSQVGDTANIQERLLEVVKTSEYRSTIGTQKTDMEETIIKDDLPHQAESLNSAKRSKTFEFSIGMDKALEDDQDKDEKEEDKIGVLLHIDKEGIDKLVGVTSFECILEIEKGEEGSAMAETDVGNMELEVITRLIGKLEIEKIIEDQKREEEEILSEKGSINELNFKIKPGKEQTGETDLSENDIMYSETGSKESFEIIILDKENELTENDALLSSQDGKYEFNCTIEIENDIDEEQIQECKKQFYIADIITQNENGIESCKEKRLETGIYSEDETLENLRGMVKSTDEFDQQDKKQNVLSQTMEKLIKAENIVKTPTADEQIFDTLDSEELLVFEELFEELLLFEEKKITRKRANASSIILNEKRDMEEEISANKTVKEITVDRGLPVEEGRLNVIEKTKEFELNIFRDDYKEKELEIEGSNKESYTSCMVSHQLPFINTSDHLEYAQYTTSMAAHQVIQTIQDSENFDSEMVATAQKTTEDMFTEIECFERRAEANTKRKAFIIEIAEKVAISQKRTENIFSEIEGLAVWKLEVDRRAEANKKREALKKEIAEKIAEAQKRTEDMFSEIECLAVWKLEVDRRKEINLKNEAFKIEIAEKVAKAQKRTTDMFIEIEGLGAWKLEVDRRAEANEKREKSSFEIKERVTKSEKRAENMIENEGLAFWKSEVEIKSVGKKKETEICYIFKEEAKELLKTLFPERELTRDEPVHFQREKLKKFHKKKETEKLLEMQRIEDLKEEADISLVEGKMQHIQNKEGSDDVKDALNSELSGNEKVVFNEGRKITQNDNISLGKDGLVSNEALIEIDTKHEQLEQLSQETFQQVTSILPMLSVLWFFCVVLKLFMDEIQHQHEEEKKSSEFEYFDVLKWP